MAAALVSPMSVGIKNGEPRSAAVATDPFSGHRLVALDLETTGLDRRRDRIVEYAMVGSDADGSEILIERFVDPERPIPMEAARVHGISDNDVRDAGTFQTHAGSIASMLEGAVLVGHNVIRFDWPFLRTEFIRAGVAPPTPLAIIDTLALARRLKVPGRHALGVLAERFGIDLTNAHRAGADAGACLLLLHIWSRKHPREFSRSPVDLESWISNPVSGGSDLGPGLDDLEPVEGSRGKLRWSEGELVLAFGKHRKRTIGEVRESDPSYLRWLLSPNGPFDLDINALLSEHLE